MTQGRSVACCMFSREAENVVPDVHSHRQAVSGTVQRRCNNGPAGFFMAPLKRSSTWSTSSWMEMWSARGEGQSGHSHTLWRGIRQFALDFFWFFFISPRPKFLDFIETQSPVFLNLARSLRSDHSLFSGFWGSQAAVAASYSFVSSVSQRLSTDSSPLKCYTGLGSSLIRLCRLLKYWKEIVSLFGREHICEFACLDTGFREESAALRGKAKPRQVISSRDKVWLVPVRW